MQLLFIADHPLGWMEVMLDRRLMQDDNRGLGQGVKDNVLTLESFRLLLEKQESHTNVSNTFLCRFYIIVFSQQLYATLSYPSLLSHSTVDNLLHPVLLFLSEAPSTLSELSPYSALTKAIPCDLHLLNFRTLFTSQPTVTEAALILHRRGFDCAFGTHSDECSLTNGQVWCY